MDLSQVKLSKTEWMNIEILVSDQEKQVLRLIQDGYHNLNIKRNENSSMLSLMKIEYTPEIETYLYLKYFEKEITGMVTKYNFDNKKWNIIQKFIKIIRTKTKPPKKVDMLRLNNMETNITKQMEHIFEYKQLDFCKNILKSLYSKTDEYTFDLYTLVQMKKSTISYINKFVIEFVNLLIDFVQDVQSGLIRDIVHNSYTIIEKNQYLLKYEDKCLYEHQKRLFQIFKNNNKSIPRLVLYTAPTGTGKTLSPLGLSEEYRIIFICAARHVGLALAKSAISMERKVAFAFGCQTASDIRLHYFAASDYTRDRRSGGIRKVDNSVGDKVEIMICDVASYITAMHYMMAFNNKENIILYWDEPTISMDYEEHPLHEIIHKNWEQNQISKVVLSCATLPREEEILETLVDFRAKFDGADIHTISSYDCKKSISILNKNSNCVLPHLLFENYNEIEKCLDHCDKNRSLLRYFDLEEIVRFIEFVCSQCWIDELYMIDKYFTKMDDITMNSMKFYYLEVLKRLHQEHWVYIYNFMSSSQLTKFSNKRPEEFRKSKSMNNAPLNPPSPSSTKGGSKITRTTSVQCIQPKPVDVTSITRIQSALQFPSSGTKVSTNTGVLITTNDAHTLTDGPTIFLAEDVEKIGKFYIQQSKIPSKVFDHIMEKIEKNNDVQQRIEVQLKNLEDKMGTEADKEKKAAKEDAYNPEIKKLMNMIESLRSEIRMVALDSVFIPNTKQHQQVWVSEGKLVENAFIPTIEEDGVKKIMELDVDNQMKLLLLMGIGMFVKDVNLQYTEIMKKLAYEQKLFLIIASSDYIYGTNYQFAHSFLGKDLLNMTQQKIIQAMGRVGRSNIQQEYTIRFRDDMLLLRLFLPVDSNLEAVNMCKLFNV